MQPMTETTNRYGIYAVDYTTFGGEITIEDFNTTLPNRKRTTKQRYMINKSTQRKERQKYKNMTLEEANNHLYNEVSNLIDELKSIE